MLGPFTTASRLTPIQQMSLAALSRAACASMSTTTPTTTTTTRDRGDRCGPMEWAQLQESWRQVKDLLRGSYREVALVECRLIVVLLLTVCCWLNSNHLSWVSLHVYRIQLPLNVKRKLSSLHSFVVFSSLFSDIVLFVVATVYGE